MRLRPAHYWRRQARQRRPERFAGVVCDPDGTIAKLSAAPQAALSGFDRLIAFVTTAFKFLGIEGWEETGCRAEGQGRPVRDAQHSTDGFWTIDLRLEAFAIGATAAELAAPRYIRLEVEPGTKAHEICASHRVLEGAGLAFGGAVVVDSDGPFLEVHPEDEFQIVPSA
jgi:hypothetical protein